MTDEDGVTDSATTTVTVGQSDSVVDNFEDGNLNEYSVSETEAQISAATTRAKDGDHALEFDFSADCVGTSKVTSTAGLDNYPQPGVAVTWWSYFESDHEVASSFFISYQDDSTWLRVVFREWKNELQIEQSVNGDRTVLATASKNSLPTDQWVKWNTTWESDGTVTLSVAGEQISGTTDISTGYGVQIAVYNGCGAAHDSKYFDDITVTAD